jgi:hypothetical protein
MEPFEADNLVDELLAIKSEVTNREFFKLLAFEVTPATKIAKVLLARGLSDDELRGIVVLSFQRGCLDDIWDEFPQGRLSRGLLKTVLVGALDAGWTDGKRMAWIERFGTMLMEQKNAIHEDFIFVIRRIPALRDIGWAKLVAIWEERGDRSINVDHFISALSDFSDEDAEQKAVWILKTWPSVAAARLLGSKSKNIALIAARHLLDQPNFNDDGIARLTCWDKFDGTDIPTRAIERTLLQEGGVDKSLSSILLSSFATDAQKEQAAERLLMDEELSRDRLVSIASFVPAQAATAKARLDRIIASEAEQETPKQKIMNRLIELNFHYPSRFE